MSTIPLVPALYHQGSHMGESVFCSCQSAKEEETKTVLMTDTQTLFSKHIFNSESNIRMLNANPVYNFFCFFCNFGCALLFLLAWQCAKMLLCLFAKLLFSHESLTFSAQML